MGVLVRLGKANVNRIKSTPPAEKKQFNYRKQGKAFEADTVRSLKGRGYVLRLYDTQDWQEVTDNKNLITGKQPSDFLFIESGDIYFIECKSTRNPIYIPFTNFKEHQLGGWEDIEKHGKLHAYHFHFIGYYPYRKTPSAYLVRSELLQREYNRAKAKKEKGVYWNFIRKYGEKVDRISGQQYLLVEALHKVKATRVVPGW